MCSVAVRVFRWDTGAYRQALVSKRERGDRWAFNESKRDERSKDQSNVGQILTEVRCCVVGHAPCVPNRFRPMSSRQRESARCSYGWEKEVGCCSVQNTGGKRRCFGPSIMRWMTYQRTIRPSRFWPFRPSQTSASNARNACIPRAAVMSGVSYSIRSFYRQRLREDRGRISAMHKLFLAV